jgi:hypothetical protein
MELDNTTLPYPKPGTPKRVIKSRILDRAIGAGALIFDINKTAVSFSYTWEPVTSDQRDDLKEAFMSAYNSFVAFTNENDIDYLVYTDNWKCKYLARSDTTYLYSISFEITGTLGIGD